MGELYLNHILITLVCKKEGRKKMKEGRKESLYLTSSGKLKNFPQS